MKVPQPFETFCRKGGHISNTFPLRNGPQKASTSKLKKTWVKKSNVTNHQGPKNISVPKVS